MKETILFFAYNKWSNWGGHDDLVREFSHKNQVVFVECMLRYGEESAKNFSDYLKNYLNGKARKVSDNLVVIPSPPMMPYALPIVSRIWRKEIAELSIKLSKRLQSWYITRQLKRLGFKPTIVIFCEAFDLVNVGRLGKGIYCYRTYDEITNFFSNRYLADVIDDIENKNIHKVDFVFTSSKAQYEKRKLLHKGVFLVPNAASFGRYNRAVTDEFKKPSDIRNIPPPIIGLISTFDFRMDFALLQAIAKFHPEWSLVIIGPVREYSPKAWKESINNLKSLQNVHFLGQRDVEVLPAYMKYFDIGIIPFIVNSITNTMYPCKLHEYLAAGLPVVSTDLYEVKSFESIICLAKSKEEFINMIEEELRTNSAWKKKKRIEIASQNSWATRAEQILFLVNKKRKQRSGSQND
jgi:glycosyltransferase involved in cell wall biosynthesis